LEHELASEAMQLCFVETFAIVTHNGERFRQQPQPFLHLDPRAHLYRNLRFGNNALFSNGFNGGKRECQNNPRFIITGQNVSQNHR
jgi:hypothetical protein